MGMGLQCFRPPNVDTQRTKVPWSSVSAFVTLILYSSWLTVANGEFNDIASQISNEPGPLS